MIHHNPRLHDIPLRKQLIFWPRELEGLDRPRDLPTEVEIEKRAAEVRAGWNAQTERRRRSEPDERYVEIAEVSDPLIEFRNWD
jgi:hypothetical protein